MKYFQKGMETPSNEIGEVRRPGSTTDNEPAALDIIRTETVLSRLPVHNLAKRGNVNIQILKTTPDGKVDLKWIVSYSDRYGQARQLAYKLDTIVINHHIDEQGRPIPKMICLGSLRDVADQLDLGGDTNKVRRALRQNASAFITAKFEYRGNDGGKKTLEADFTRYSVVFTGEQLPDGRRADAVYIILNEPYREVLNNAPVRPLDRAYMKELPPAAQRFYEIISYKIFSAIKNDYPHAKIAYSEYCTFSAQLRHYERQPVQDQMAKVIRPHKQSGYIVGVRYQPTIDADNNPDWILYLSPGPKAQVEFAVAHGRRPRKALEARVTQAGDNQSHRLRASSRESQQQSKPLAIQQSFDPVLASEITRRGIAEDKARALLANLKPGQDKHLIAQLEHAEQTIQQLQNSPNPVRNPAGFIIRLIELNTPVPDGFETSAERKAREEREREERAQRAAKEAEQQLEWAYDDYREAEIDRAIAANPALFEEIKNARWKEDREKYTFASESIARAEARNEIRKQLTFLTLEEFRDRKKRGTDFSLLKLVGPSAAQPASIDEQVAQATGGQGTPETVPEVELPAAEPQAESPVTAIDSGAVPGDLAPTTEPGAAIAVPAEPGIEEATTTAPEPEVAPAMQEPMMVELVSDPPQEEPGGSVAVADVA
ncbi:MAG TPA: hypothetical protein VMH80_07975 [Bryobacteraceae bacterium]|nr:hypothetical protein [Bryobacteraceae bacterium]